jgi:hypothetical protein
MEKSPQDLQNQDEQKTTPDSARGFHKIEDDLTETWVEDWAAAGTAEIESYLSKHAAFLIFLKDSGQE